MRNILEHLVLLIALALIVGVGCVPLAERSGRLTERLGEAIQDYCGHSNAEDRAALRARINDASSPHRVEVTCGE